MDYHERQRPEELLELARESESSTSGKLRIYLGMCPGVGKTFAMLEDAQRRMKENPDLLVGLVETHGRKETIALLENLPLLPRTSIIHRDSELKEFDLDAALLRKPNLILVDELAHTNAPGSRHPKRWQDVEELLAAGINVWTTVNIQHVESLRDAIMDITRIHIQETVPDTFLDDADEIRVIDLTPEQLRQRLAEGKIYLAERAGAAAEGFFREGNLRALREMALRFAARKVDAEKRKFMRSHLIPGPWRASERFLVAVGSSPHSQRLIRIACRLAQAQDTGWVAAHVDTGTPLDEAASRQLAANLALARSLGAETISFPNEDLVKGILHISRRENITQIIVGKAPHQEWFQRILGRRLSDRLTYEGTDIDLLLVHPSQENFIRNKNKWFPAESPFNFNDTVLAGITLLAVTLFGMLVEPIIGYRSIALFYVLAVACAGVFISRWTVLTMAFCGSLAWNFFFTDPRYTFGMLSLHDIMLLLTSLVVALVIGHLTTRLRQRETASRLGEQRSRALYQLTRVTSASPSLAHGVKAALKQVENIFSCRASLLEIDGEAAFHTIGGEQLSAKEESLCRWALDHGQAAGKFTDTLPQSLVLALPLTVNGKSSSVLALRPTDTQLSSPVARDLLETFAAHFSVMLEKEEHQRAQRDAALSEKSRQFQRALLDHVSHEIKTPVAVIQAGTELLLQGKPNPEVLVEIKEAALRLNRVFNQLVTLSKAEAGLIHPTLELCDAHDLIKDTIQRFPSTSISIHGNTFTFQTDPSILDTILFNLLQNALYYGDGKAEISCTQNSHTTRFEISNTGNPIPDHERSRIFERFQRGLKTKTGGMGLGLPIAQEFACLLGGEIKLDSSVTGRTVFYVQLPIRTLTI